MMIPLKLRKLIKENKTFLIVSHINPDGDAVGSVIALALGFKKLGKRVYILSKSPVPEIFRFLPYSKLINNKIPTADFDVLFLLDCNTLERTGFTALPAKSIAVIDHHLTASKNKYRVNLIDPSVSATGELIYNLLHALRVPIDRNIATNLYTAIFTDTGGFKYSNTSVKTLKIAASMIEAGVNTWEVSKEVYESMSVNRFRLFTSVLSTFEKQGKIACITVTRAMFKKTHTTAEDTENFVDHARGIKGIEVGILFREDAKNSYKISLRSKGSVNVASIAKSFGGGGHASAAGCKQKGTLKEVKDKVFKALRKAINKK